MVNTKPKANTDFNTIYFNDSDGAVSGNILANDTDPNGDPLFLRFLDGTRVGTPGGKGGATDTVVGKYGTFFVKSDGSYTYTLDKTNPAVMELSSTGPGLEESVSYKIIDSAGATDFDYLKISILGPNAKPNAADDFASIKTGDVSASGNILANDTDGNHPGGAAPFLEVARAGGENINTANPNDYSLKFVANTGTTVVEGKYGFLTIDRDGHYDYHINTQDADYIALNGATAVDNFQYRIADDAYGSVPNSNSTDVAILHITVNDGTLVL